MRLISYKAFGPRSTVLDKLVGLCTLGEYSHSEIQFNNGQCFSISPRENNLRIKTITVEEPQWDIIDLEVDPKLEVKILKYCREQVKLDIEYDYLGALFSALPFCFQNSKKYFCSEICTDILRDFGIVKLLDGCRYTPSELREEVKDQI